MQIPQKACPNMKGIGCTVCFAATFVFATSHFKFLFLWQPTTQNGKKKRTCDKPDLAVQNPFKTKQCVDNERLVLVFEMACMMYIRRKYYTASIDRVRHMNRTHPGRSTHISWVIVTSHIMSLRPSRTRFRNRITHECVKTSPLAWDDGSEGGT